MASLARFTWKWPSRTKLYVDNPTLLRLRELEAVEKIATAGKLSVVLGEKGLADRIVKLI